MNILLSEYGDYSNLPVEISGNIIDVEMKQITSSIKSNYPFLSHLNIGSIIFFVEIDINKLISNNTRKKFSHVLNERAKKRRLLSNEEKNYEEFIHKKSIREQEELKNYYSYQNQLKILRDIQNKENKDNKNNTNEKNNNNDNSNINKELKNDNNEIIENNNEENKKEEENKNIKNIKK